MSRARIKFGAIAVAVLVILAAFILLPPARGPILLEIRGYVTNRLDDEAAAKFGMRDYVCAVIALTNTTSRVISFFLRDPYGMTDYSLQHRSGLIWEDAATPLSEDIYRRQDELVPGQGYTFEALVDPSQPCRIALDYHTDMRLLDRLPVWLTSRLPWNTGWRMAVTDIIDLRQPNL